MSYYSTIFDGVARGQVLLYFFHISNGNWLVRSLKALIIYVIISIPGFIISKVFFFGDFRIELMILLIIELMILVMVECYIERDNIKAIITSYMAKDNIVLHGDYKYRAYDGDSLYVTDKYNFIFKMIGSTKYRAVFGILQANIIRQLSISECYVAILDFGLYIDPSAYNRYDLSGRDPCYINDRVCFITDDNRIVTTIYANGINRKLTCNERKLALFLGLVIKD